MKLKLIAGLIAALFSAALFTMSAEAKVRHHKSHHASHVVKHKHKKHAVKVHKRGSKLARHGKHRNRVAIRSRGASEGARNNVVAIIKGSAPRHGVPTWFALRIAKVESNYNPNARGSAGEYGVYQLKCATARGIGFRGNCSALLNPYTNVQYGLKHLSMALRLSGGNLKLAASKHNGGLGTKRLVRRYVAAVF